MEKLFRYQRNSTQNLGNFAISEISRYQRISSCLPFLVFQNLCSCNFSTQSSIIEYHSHPYVSTNSLVTQNWTKITTFAKNLLKTLIFQKISKWVKIQKEHAQWIYLWFLIQFQSLHSYNQSLTTQWFSKPNPSHF